MRVLIVSPHFPPTNAADMQRVRMILPYLADNGVAAEVLSVEANQVAAPQDVWLAQGLPDEVPVHRVEALGLKWTRLPGLGVLTSRALRAIGQSGDALLDSGNFDLVYFSTTQFGIHVLGPRWKRRFRVPFVMDYQDPWVSDYYREHPEVFPPGGRLKHGVSSWISRRQEPRVLRECSGITSVSAAYPQQLANRYPWLKIIEQTSEVRDQRTGIWNGKSEERDQRSDGRDQKDEVGAPGGHSLPVIVIPFPGDLRDFERVKAENVGQSVFDPNDGLTHWVYVGRGGEDMALAVRAIFLALQSTLNSQPSTFNRLRLHFIGTSYAAAGQGRKTIEPLAAEIGLHDIVTEHPDRIPYSETLRCLLDADALIIPGSDHPGYTASKIYPYLLAEKPLLAIFHEGSSVVSLIRQVGGGMVVPFATGEEPDQIAKRIGYTWFDGTAFERVVPLDRGKFGPFTAQAQARTLRLFFDACLENNIQ